MGNWYRQVLISTALAQLEGTISRLHQGAVVADVGCGSGIQVSGRGESRPPPTRLASGPGSVAPEGGCGPIGREVGGDGRRRGESDQISGRAGIPVGTVHEYPTSGPSCAPPTRAFTTEIASTGPATSRPQPGNHGHVVGPCWLLRQATIPEHVGQCRRLAISSGDLPLAAKRRCTDVTIGSTTYVVPHRVQVSSSRDATTGLRPCATASRSTPR